MSQNQNIPDWISASGVVLTIIGAPVAWIVKRITGSVSRKEFKEYLEARDKLSEERHTQNLDKLDKLTDAVSGMGQRLSHVEGAMSGSYRRPS